ncbi:hypothetical protein J2Z83_003142 [Virgibacillus natechei]|uniref:Uncharacterized protein n=1 Tax=Virgibacillus natechei TaxID=1216297 RepID=A0ABS4IJ54_9BACI|nr:hypothetical protein [Virgibacillus natechei]MBP1971005.1 hypothetical protein [Virgibacillus natechei]
MRCKKTPLLLIEKAMTLVEKMAEAHTLDETPEEVERVTGIR